jgi:hypothetical protein
MLRRLMVLWLVAWALAAAAAPALAAGPVFPRGSRIGLEPPGDMVVSRRFNGFEDRAHNVAITMLDLPAAAYRALEKSAFQNKVKRLTVEKREVFPFREGIGYLVTGHEEVNGTLFRSWYLLANTFSPEVGRVAAMVAVRLPNNATRIYPDRVIRAALASVTFRKPPLAEMLSLLPFQLGNRAGFRVARISPPAVVMLIDGEGGKPAERPYMVVAAARNAPSAPDLRPKFARDLVQQMPLAGLAIQSAAPMRINNRPGYEVRATAKRKDGKPLALVQWLRYGGGNTYLRIIGIVEQPRWDELFPRFRAVRDGVDVR